jgi:MFS family permease
MALIAVIGATATVASSSLMLAKLAVVSALPVLVFGVFAGLAADRWSRRRILIVTDLIRAGLVVSIPCALRWAGSAWPVYLLVFGVFLVGLPFNAAKMAVIPDMVSSSELLRANAILTSSGRAATVLGIVAGGVIVEWTGWRRVGWHSHEAGFYVDAATYVVSACTIAAALLSRRSLRDSAVLTTPDAVGEGHRHDLADAWRDIRTAAALMAGNRRLRFVLMSVGAVTGIAGAVYALGIVFVQSVLHFGTRGVGLEGGVLAAGVLVGSALTGVLGEEWNRHRTIGVGLTGLGGSILGLAAAQSVVTVGVAAFCAGLCLAPVMVSQDTALQAEAPPAVRGRVFAVKDILSGACFASAALLAGFAASGHQHPAGFEVHRALLGAVGAATVVIGIAACLATSRTEPARVDSDPGDSLHSSS